LSGPYPKFPALSESAIIRFLLYQCKDFGSVFSFTTPLVSMVYGEIPNRVSDPCKSPCQSHKILLITSKFSVKTRTRKAFFSQSNAPPWSFVVGPVGRCDFFFPLKSAENPPVDIWLSFPPPGRFLPFFSRRLGYDPSKTYHQKQWYSLSFGRSAPLIRSLKRPSLRVIYNLYWRYPLFLRLRPSSLFVSFILLSDGPGRSTSFPRPFDTKNTPV